MWSDWYDNVSKSLKVFLTNIKEETILMYYFYYFDYNNKKSNNVGIKHEILPKLWS